MCGVVGVVVKGDKPFPVAMFRRLMQESQVRGQHASGVAFEIAGYMYQYVEPQPWLNCQPLPSLFPTTKMAIGHTRYSTSNLDYNQPIFLGERALVLNGVVTQAEPSTWKETFGVNCEGKNDAEILLQMWNNDRHPLDIEASSQACLILDADKRRLTFWRNGGRPLYYWQDDDYLVVASTASILERSGLMQPTKCVAGTQYDLTLYPDIKPSLVTITGRQFVDLQEH